jgi:hypothetical protein
MAEGKPLSTKDLFLLIVGLQKLIKPPKPSEAASAEKYWLDKDGALRESEWNWDWIADPKAAWESVRYRYWLFGNLLANLTGHNQEFSAISEPLLFSMDVLTNEFKPGMSKATPAINKILTSKGGYKRSFLTTLSLGLSKQQSNNQEVVVFGAGMRRRTRIWLPNTEEEALQADVEFFVPFYVAPGEGKSVDDAFPGARSICAGIAITRANGNSIGTDTEGKDIAAMRFNFRIPFTARVRKKNQQDDSLQIPTTVTPPPTIIREPDELETTFGAPVIEAQKRNWVKTGATQTDWEKFPDWKIFVEEFCKKDESKELLNAPIGPLLLETVSGDASLKDLILKKSRREAIKKDLAEVEKELTDTAELLKGLLKWQVPEENEETEKSESSSSERKLGSLLESVGLMSRKDGGYLLNNLAKLTVWDVVNRLFDELDGFPLYVKGVDAKTDTGTRIAVALASQAAPTNPRKHYFGLAGMAYNIPIKTAPKKVSATEDGDTGATPIILDEDNFVDDESLLIDDEDEQEEAESGVEEEPPAEEAGEKSALEIRLHLGKWFAGETLEDNWFRRLLPPVQITEKAGWKRRVPLPGIRILPFQREQATDNTQANYTMALRADLLSLGFDFKGTTKDGLTFLQFQNGPLAYFGLGEVETRMALLFSGERVAFGLGVKLKNLRLSFGPKEKDEKKDKKEPDDDLMGGLQELLADDWVVVPAPEKPKRKMKTRLSAKKKDKFSISVGYLSPLTEGSHGTLDIQLYDQKGNRGKMVWIPIDRRSGTVYLKQIGIALKGVENLELSKGLSNSARLTVALTGGLRWPAFELGFIGAQLSFPLKKPGDVEFALDGLDISLKMGSVIISGSFLKSGLEYAGSVTIDLPKFSIGAMGFYGNLRVFSKSFNKEVFNDLWNRKLHADLRKTLKEKEVEVTDNTVVRRGFSEGYWEFKAADNKTYSIVEDGDKLTVLSPDKTLFIYGMLSAASGGGVKLGPIEFTAIALGFGLNRRIEVPSVDGVAEFPLVKMVMGEGGYQEKGLGDDLRNQMSKPVKDPVSVLADMKDGLPAERGQYVICGGVRFTIATTVDCFGLIIVQFGNDFEFALLGLARFRQPSDLSAKPICYVEMQILMTIKPGEGTFKLQALLTSNSWIINQDCKLTGGFAVYVWFSGEHKDDFVITLGGYHPRFRRPDHYPIVPRLGLNWPVNDALSIKGGVYLAITPSCCMLGAKLEATFHSGRVSAWFTAYLDVIIAWSPFHFEADIGVSLRVEADFAVTSLKITISATVEMWGPPVGGIARVNLTLISFDVPFGKQREEAKPKLVESWAQFSRSFLKASEADEKAMVKPVDKAVPVAPITQPNLKAGRNNVSNLPGASREPKDAARDNAIWKVRADELELAASTAVPVATLNVGCAKTGKPSEGVQARGLVGQSALVTQPLALESKGLHSKTSKPRLGVQPMGKTLDSLLNVTIVRDEVSETLAVDLTKWIVEEETSSLPAALWDAEKPKPQGPSEPSAKLIPNCITGIKRLKPPAGKCGSQAALSEMTWQRLDPANVPLSGAAQEVPSALRSRHVQAAVASKQEKQKQVFEALATVGFNLACKPAQSAVDFRELQADPLAGAVASSA